MNLLFDFMRGKRTPTKPTPPKRTKPYRPRPSNFARGHAKRRKEYEALVEELTKKYDIRVKRWRSNTSGCAWTITKRDGTTTRWLESPYPTGPVSCAVFLHEVGHHAIGLGIHKPRCLEEHLAWQWAINAMEERKLNVSDAVKTRVRRSMQYAVSKAVRRGIKKLPAELVQYLER